MKIIPEKSGVVLGYFADHDAANTTFEQLVANGFRRVALLRRNADDSLTVLNHRATTRQQTALATTTGAVMGAAVAGLAWPFLPGGLPVKALLSSAAVLGGAGAGQQTSARAFTHIPDALLNQYAQWLMRDESLVMVVTAPMRIARAQSVLREDQAARPTIFTRRPPVTLLPDDGTTQSAARYSPASPEQLQQRAERLAARHKQNQSTEPVPRHQLLLARLLDNQRVITQLHQQLSIAARTEGAPSLSAEWLLDNHYIIQGQIEDVKNNLGRRFYAELPRTGDGAPRIYEIAMALIQQSDGRLDRHNITAFLTHYQQVLPLSIGELWALPQMLRLALIEHQRGLFIATGQRQQDRERADFWANRLLNAAHRDPDRLHTILAALSQEQQVVHPHFVDRLVSHLYDEDTAMLPVQSWLERKSNAPLVDISNAERARHAADQVAIANTIGSQRTLGQMDWNEIFEEISLVHHLLQQDPDEIYGKMDFATRDSYRRAVEHLAKYGRQDEIAVSRSALQLAENKKESDIPSLKNHVGYYLLDDGRAALEAACVYHPPLLAQVRRILKQNALPLYLGGIGALTVAGAIKVFFWGSGWRPLLGLLSIFPLSNIGAELINALITQLLEPASLPRLDFKNGIPAECKTLVVIPMLLTSVAETREAVEQLEIRYLGNIDPQIRFALLADYIDAATATTDADVLLRDTATEGINNLNIRYPNAPFHLFLRDRRWCKGEAKWMGWERKRGKLEELNNWLRGDHTPDAGHLHPVAGNAGELENIRYVLTLDADTQLPPDCARHLIETITHPLNRAMEKNGVVNRGYTIIQPRINVTLPSANANRFTQLFAAGAGTDPYTHAVSDVYQDLFGESSFQGKGIYDLEMFHRHLAGRFPDSTILSHDLLEGTHVRTGLASEIELFDDFPSSYVADTSRVHRWIRGDWQIADWATPRVPDSQGRLVPNPLSLLSRWKIGDNLRRSLVRPALMGLLIGGWVSSAPAMAGLLAAGCLFAPAGLKLIRLFCPPYGNGHQEMEDWRDVFLRNLIETAFLPHSAAMALDAVGKVWERRLITHQGLLEWQTAQAASRSAGGRQKLLLRQLNLVSALSLTAAGLMGGFLPTALPWALPFLGLWSAGPLFARWLQGGAPVNLESTLQGEDHLWLRRVARRTWRYFDDFVGPQTNWLPPDNYQETLQVEIAQRTSPTNIGLWLLAVLAAKDFGYLPLDDAIGRVLETLRTTEEMEKFNGHLLNWYNIGTLEPLRPRYVSTVDSGNLLGSLTTLENGFRDRQHAPLLSHAALSGTLDSIHVLEETLHLPQDDWGKELTNLLERLKALLSNKDCPASQIIPRLREALPLAEALTACVQRQNPALAGTTMEPGSTLDPRQGTIELNYWSAAIEQQLQSWNHLCNRYFKWMEDLASVPPEFFATLGEEAILARQVILETIPSLESLGHGNLPEVKILLSASETKKLPAPLADWLQDFKTAFERAQWLAGEMLAGNHELLDRTRKLADEMDLKFLYDASLGLFTIGFDVDELRLDSSFYDLLSSECRITSLIAIARNEVPVDHWWTLGRRFARAYGQTVMLSWSGTMFEYLMPMLLHEQRPHTLLDQISGAAVRTQMQYAQRRGIPWGISEAAFSDLDANSIYQYKAFGVPELGLQRGHENDLVVAPYASLLALQIVPRQAIDNLRQLQSQGAYGVYGFYDSVDFSRQRLNDTPRQEVWMQAVKPFHQGDRGTIVRTFMVHHQGMGLLAIANLLLRCEGESGGDLGIMQHRFHTDPRLRAVTPLLHERVPSAPVLLSEHQEQPLPERKIATTALTDPVSDRFRTPDTPSPRAHLLSNGHYHLMVSNAGGGYSRWNGFDLTRWRADTTTDSMGAFFYIRDLDSRVTWSAAHHPVRRAARYQNVDFKAEKVDFRRRDADIETQTSVFVSPEDDVEIRLITLTNHSTHARQLEITSYQELALAPHATDRAHPAFAKLFVQTEALTEEGECALLAWRRLREPAEMPVWAAHFFTAGRHPQSTSGQTVRQSCSFETSREHFLGRGRSPHRPEALEKGLTNTAGAVLDPVFSLQQRWTLAPGEHLQLASVTAAGESREKVLLLRDKYRGFAAIERAADLAWTHAQLEMHHLRIQPEEAQLYQQLAGGMLYPQAHYRARSAQLRQNNLGQQALWSLGISGDLPIIVATLAHERDMATLRQVLMAHTFWNLRGLSSDLVILNQQSEGYMQTLTEQIQRLVGPHTQYTPLDKPGGIFVRGEGQLDKEHLTLLLASAHVVVVSARGSLAGQLATPPTPPPTGPRLVMAHRPEEEPSPPLPFMELPYFNGLGGFTTDGKEFAIYLGPGTQTPAPWINVMANPRFGQMVSEAGHGYVWHGNSQSNRLTDWSNDPVMDPINDLIYIRDNQTGAFWSPTPGPIRENDAYRARHGQGYTIWEHNSHAIEQELLSFVPLNVNSEEAPLPLRIQRLRLKNVSSHMRQLSLTGYHEWVLGENQENTALHVNTQWDNSAKILLAQNSYHSEFGGMTAFSSSNPPAQNFNADRTLFIGRNQSLRSPASMRRRQLIDRCGAGLDACAALQFSIELEPGEEQTVFFFMGQTTDVDEIRRLVQRFRDPAEVETAFEQTKNSWDSMLGTLQVETPIVSTNFLLNRWLLYQNLSCRFWGRSAFYQSGGAFGFRDQLQDVMALVYMRPDVARLQLLRASAHQFEEGDVQHWWHQASGAGVRTRISDDLLWLPYVAMHYMDITGDHEVLLEEEHFLHAPPLKDGEHEKYFSPEISEQKATLYEHCCRAIDKGCTSGPHNLPLIGTGDWNDGLNAVGEGGKGESIWLGWFLVDILRRFAQVCEQQNDKARAKRYRQRATRYVKAIEESGWDGQWYRRAYYDDGTPIGSAQNDEDKIDVLPQAWAILSGAADPQRAEQAMQAAMEHLVKRDDKMVLLFTPPFDKSEKNPGYIKGYLPGVRENGGQYTHGALWLALAYAFQGKGATAVELLQLLNPVEHTKDAAGLERYKVEPYVVAADVYALENQVGRGGWTWYTGSAGWMYRVWLEGVLGFLPRAGKLYIDPHIPADWKEYKIDWRYKTASYQVHILNPKGRESGVSKISLDGEILKDSFVPLSDDGKTHQVEVVLG